MDALLDEEIATPAAGDLAAQAPLAEASVGELASRLTQGVGELVTKEVELAKAELREDGKLELRVVIAWTVSAVCALIAVNLLFVAIVFAWLPALPGWASALVAMGLTLIVGAASAVFGWKQRVKKPLERTQRTLKEDLQWAKQRLT